MGRCWPKNDFKLSQILLIIKNLPVSSATLCSWSAAGRWCSRKCRITLSIGWGCLKLTNFRLKNSAMVISICKCFRKCFYIFFLLKQLFFSERIKIVETNNQRFNNDADAWALISEFYPQKRNWRYNSIFIKIWKICLSRFLVAKYWYIVYDS